MILQFHEHIFQMDGKKTTNETGWLPFEFFFFFSEGGLFTLGIQSPSENGDGT